jgi:hypothetical protein
VNQVDGLWRKVAQVINVAFGPVLGLESPRIITPLIKGNRARAVNPGAVCLTVIRLAVHPGLEILTEKPPVFADLGSRQFPNPSEFVDR